MIRARWVAAGVLVAVVLGAAAAVLAPAAPRTDALPPPASDLSAPTGARIKVEVLNTTRTRGLARRAAMLLRDRGFDVVYVANAGPAEARTQVLDRSGHPEWARRAAEVMAGARVVTRPDSSRYVDITVLIGGDWRPPPQPFRP